jgi:hypothetical protein
MADSTINTGGAVQELSRHVFWYALVAARTVSDKLHFREPSEKGKTTAVLCDPYPVYSTSI